MAMTRVDTKKLQDAVADAETHIQAALNALEPLLILLTEEERARTLRAPKGFPEAARKLAGASGDHPQIVAATEFVPEAVTEDLDNVAVLSKLEAPLARLDQLIADSKLAWTAEAYMPSLQLYGVAKVRAKSDAKLQLSIAPLADVFATRRTTKPEPTEG
ncbi:MAG: hypothetical protein ACOC1F_12745 [Myxococcota bacterium]